MDSEIAELRTMTKVTRLRKEIECREEGAWMVVKDIPDKTAPSGSRKVTAYGRTRRSVTRSVSSNADFGNTFPELPSIEPLVQHPVEEDDSKDLKPTTVEITEVFDEPLRVNLPQDIPQNTEKTNHKKTSVVTLGKGNLVLIDPEDESNFHVTGISKGKVADVVSTLERSYDKKPKKVGFCKTEVHFAPDSGKINIVETDEKPPPTQVYRKKKRSRGIKNKQSSCLPKHYFGELTEFADDSNLLNESDREDSRPPLTFTHNIEVLPQVKQIFPTFERTIKSENKDVKYRYSSPEKNDSDLEIDKFHLDEKDFFRKLKQPSFRERFLKETESLAEKKSSGVSHSPLEDVKNSNPQINDHDSILNGFLSRHNSSDIYSKDKFGNVREENDNSSEPELKYTELFKIPLNENNDRESSPIKLQELKNATDIRNSEENKKSDYGLLNKKKSSADEMYYDFTPNVSRVPIDQELRTDISFLGSMSPKLKNLIKNSVEHEFQLRQKQILQKRTIEKKSVTVGDANKIKSPININLSASENEKEEKKSVQKEIKLKPSKTVTQVKLGTDNETKHEFQLKREQITKSVSSEPVYDDKEFEFKEMLYLLKEEPIPAPREKVQVKQKNKISSLEPPKPKPRTIVSASTEKNRGGRVSSRHSMKSESSTLSRRVRSRENLLRSKEGDRMRCGTPVSKEDVKTRRSAALTSRMEGSIQRLPKSNVHSRKTVRGEPLRSFEKVSNGWVGIVPTKQDDKMSPKVTVTTKVYSNKTLAQQSTQHVSEMSGEMEEMTASYSEICEGGSRPSQLELLTRLDGTVTKEGALISFVADDLETKLRLASPRGILAALESEACAVAASVDSLTESLADTLHGISALTVDCLEVYTGVVCKTCDSIDANIKAMYQLMAKSEELSKAMAPLYRLSGHIKNIKHLLDLIEANPS